jgi:hypothetical protein
VTRLIFPRDAVVDRDIARDIAISVAVHRGRVSGFAPTIARLPGRKAGVGWGLSRFGSIAVGERPFIPRGHGPPRENAYNRTPFNELRAMGDAYFAVRRAQVIVRFDSQLLGVTLGRPAI